MSSFTSFESEPKWSLFIPSINFQITKNKLKDVMEKKFGKLSRVDFVSFNSENGCGRRAFIHFSEWFDTDFTRNLKKEITEKEYVDIHIDYSPIRLMRNKNPVPETEQTLPQVVSNIDFMAEKIRIQEARLEEQPEKIEMQNQEIEGLKQQFENMFYQLQLLQNRGV
jgi:hypothetical protein